MLVRRISPAPSATASRAQSSASRPAARRPDRKSTRLNSSHVKNSYAVFCLKKKDERDVHHVVGLSHLDCVRELAVVELLLRAFTELESCPEFGWQRVPGPLLLHGVCRRRRR